MKLLTLRNRRRLITWIFFAFSYFLVDLLVAIAPGVNSRIPVIAELIARYHVAALAFNAALMGLAPAAAHPLNMPAYLNWLRMTPWKPGMPLPKGGVTLSWFDVATIVIFLLAARWNLPNGAIYVVIAFALAYSVGATTVLHRPTIMWELIALGFLGAAFVWFFPLPWEMLVVSMSMGAVAVEGVHRSFTRYPWEKKQPDSVTERWPLVDMHDTRPVISNRDGFIIALLASLWVAALASHANARVQDATPLIGMGIGFIALGRWIVYASKGRVPVSLLYRIFYGRLVFPKYDVVYATPLLTVLGGSGVLDMAVALKLNVPVTAGISIFVALVIALLGKPNLRTWQLTGFLAVRVPIYRPPLATKNRKT